MVVKLMLATLRFAENIHLIEPHDVHLDVFIFSSPTACDSHL